MSKTSASRIMRCRQSLRATLFVVQRDEYGVAFYTPKPGMEESAATSWREHGVCPSCHRWAISCGSCDCGWRGK